VQATVFDRFLCVLFVRSYWRPLFNLSYALDLSLVVKLGVVTMTRLITRGSRIFVTYICR